MEDPHRIFTAPKTRVFQAQNCYSLLTYAVPIYFQHIALLM